MGDLALFAGGEDSGTPSPVVDIYDDSTGLWAASSLSSARNGVAGAAVGQHVLFAGGAVSAVASADTVDIYDAQSKSWLPTASLSQARFGIGATTVGDKAIFAGGGVGGPSNAVASAVVDIYDDQTGTWTQTTLSEARGPVAAVAVGDLALFAGGTDGVAYSDRVDIYDNVSGLWTTASLSEARIVGAAVSVGGRAYFAGGVAGGAGAVSGTVDIYDAQTGQWTVAALPVPRSSLGAAALGNTILFAGGLEAGFTPTDVVDLFNVGTGQWSSASLWVARADLGATAVGGKALFAGGTSGFGSPKAVVDVYEPVGLNYCTATPNSTGCAASIGASGSNSLATNFLVLTSDCMPGGVFLFFHASTQVQIPFGDSYVCAFGDLVRILPSGSSAGGLAQAVVDLPAASITVPGQRNFQCWYRDPAAGGAGFSLSDALAVTFVP